eukprot:CAMPEP_0175960826 /NCGR_PEP_ID=MMETSP0108-20121206/35589_1 /TAXON_ID=195067 ORGANISM="Goniomonas pacifica, Strain CCMP1869" /NCGR_SAMPLE_ID=MMETSP0108 /ASSEMBLY_ACC=CAM_ASM_000204 /LENGTH=50 /DNA_ID=CAMNT_0017288475 /DNA_START=84 /DNA_END=232 /DNA_ORIENTATION=+
MCATRPVTGFPADAFPHTMLVEIQSVPVAALAPIDDARLVPTCPTFVPTT